MFQVYRSRYWSSFGWIAVVVVAVDVGGGGGGCGGGVMEVV